MVTSTYNPSITKVEGGRASLCYILILGATLG